MSLFLGKIHYWLFNKILWFEALEEDVKEILKKEVIDFQSLEASIRERYGSKTPNLPLEEIIDTSNIHGWLQERINLAEGRLAAWTSIIKNYYSYSEKELEKVFINQGVRAANEVKEKGTVLSNAVDIFNGINDYILDGMPCDRVNEVIESSEDKVEWIRTKCVHRHLWEKENCDVEYFYNLRNLWIESFVSEINKDFKYYAHENKMSIKRCY